MYCNKKPLDVLSGFCRQKKADQTQVPSALAFMDLSSAVADEAQPNVLNAGDNQCIIYTGANYTGESYVLELPEGEDSIRFAYNYGDFPNDKMVSWRCGAKIRYHFCYAVGEYECLPNDPSNGESGVGAWNSPEMGSPGTVSVIYLFAYSDMDNPAITFFDSHDCTHASHFI